MTQKSVTIKLFLDTASQTYYVQIGETLYPVRASVAFAIQEREGIDIRKVDGKKNMQLKSNGDEKI